MEDQPKIWYEDEKRKRRPRYRYRTVPGRLLCVLAYACFAMGFLCWFINLLWPTPILLGFFYGMENGEPTVAYRDVIPPGRLTDIAVNDDSLFLLYETPGVVNAYTHTGEYQYSILFPYNTKRAGVLYASGNELCYNNPYQRMVYEIADGQYRAAYAAEAGEAKLAELKAAQPDAQEDRCRYGGAEYRISGQDVLRVDADGIQTRVVNGPEILALVDFVWLWLGLPLFWLLAAVLGVTARHVDARKKQA